ncbi:glycosyltransferase family 2 protein [Phenylobacterium sp.]|uniref:glycosyltransferase family 2 protein n=1 Tax=Phenylobacterium sp. TaxID=1871053 RepID=UPI00120931B3|nr:glycosyltransferase family 2 protein [Phenylobacterium sp.]THD65098.1 MAG: glycosyltransferase family 2 protein [Phenylobacterium sp.]
MRVAVAIVAFRNPGDVEACLAALGASVHTDFEVVICENGGPQAFRELVAAIPAQLAGGQPVRAVCAPANLGYAGGVNRCLAEAPQANAWWVLNPDTAPEPRALAAMVARLARGDCEAVGSVVYLPSQVIQSLGGRWRRLFARAISLGYGRPLAETPRLAGEAEARQNYLNGASMLVSRRFVEVTGPMREDYFLYCEEVEWCLRALSLGLKLGLAPDAWVLHQQGSTTGHTANVREQGRTPVYLNERNRLLLTRDQTPVLLPLAAPLALTLILARFARRGAWRQVGYAVDGWWAGLVGRRGPPAWIEIQGP